MRFFEVIIRNWFTGMILFVLTALVLSLNTTNAAITPPYVQEKATSLFFHKEISLIAFNVIENNLESCFQNKLNLVDYRSRVLASKAIAAKGVTRVLAKFYPANNGFLGAFCR
ncbi:hypothetical protein [Belliella pelovolcani]|uniref:Uncharacterized protein n=1 Tax=Belliella pelovolcani TaxID=529505 RepID=A0A1N7PUL6_9BACT|nr:hypothetical protein [Belliella pelovolcani]SIT14245.1 hypothetical protein SAMN05421761_1218 [Belliella pelovolcani]